MKVLNKKTKRFKVKIEKDFCKGCGLCVISCPQKILFLSENINKLGYKHVEINNEEDCIGCGSCYLMCPDYLIEIYQED